MKSIRKIKRGGYSLLEMVVAAFIFAAVAVALSGVFSYHYRAIGTSRLFLVGQYLARDRMDEITSSGFDALAVVATGIPTDVIVTFTIRDVPVHVTYTILDRVDAVVPLPPLGQRNVTVDVSWSETNRTRRVVYSQNVSPDA